jgi:hypothetical protein
MTIKQTFGRLADVMAQLPPFDLTHNPPTSRTRFSSIARVGVEALAPDERRADIVAALQQLDIMFRDNPHRLLMGEAWFKRNAAAATCARRQMRQNEHRALQDVSPTLTKW